MKTSDYILVDANGRPVPLPHHTLDQAGDPSKITDYCPSSQEPNGMVYVMDETGLWEALDGWYPADDYDLRVITEAEYMEKQSCAK